MNTVKINKGHTAMVAHRGVSGIERENSCAAFVAAGNRSYFGIETDVYRTADGHFLLLHDKSTGRVAQENLSIEELPFAESRKILLLDHDGQPRGDLCLPELQEYLRICSRYEKTAVLELKNDFSTEELSAILGEVRKYHALERMIFISFQHAPLVRLREMEPQAAIQFLCSCPVDEALIAKLTPYHFDLDINYPYLTLKDIPLLHSRGIRVNCWTVNDKETAETLCAAGVDFITTNILE